MNITKTQPRFKIGFHINKKYNFVKGLTISKILVYTWIGILTLTAIFGIIAVFTTAIINPDQFGSAMNASGFEF